jgi:ABC-type polar amino acid transport system ATPase subunit
MLEDVKSVIRSTAESGRSLHLMTHKIVLATEQIAGLLRLAAGEMLDNLAKRRNS